MLSKDFSIKEIHLFIFTDLPDAEVIKTEILLINAKEFCCTIEIVDGFLSCSSS
jgi:hypothetical protein